MWENGSYWKHERSNLNQKRPALPICVTWHWTFKGKTQSLFQLLCLPIWEEKTNPLRLLSLWYYWRVDLNLRVKEWLSSLSFPNSIPAPRIHLALPCCHSRFKICFVNAGLAHNQGATESTVARGGSSGGSTTEEDAWGQETRAQKPQGCQMRLSCGFVSQVPGMQGLQGSEPQPSATQFPAVTSSLPSWTFPTAAPDFPCCALRRHLFPLHSASTCGELWSCFTFPPMVNYNRNSKFYDFVTWKSCF